MEQTQEQQSLIVLQKKLPMLVTMAVAIVLCCAVVLNFTRAWYSNNLDASAEGMQIISESPDVKFKLIIYREGVPVFNSDENSGETAWIGLLPGEEYVFFLEIYRNEDSNATNMDLQIGFLGLEGYPLGTTYSFKLGTPASEGVIMNGASQSISLPGKTLEVDSSLVNVTPEGSATYNVYTSVNDVLTDSGTDKIVNSYTITAKSANTNITLTDPASKKDGANAIDVKVTSETKPETVILRNVEAVTESNGKYVFTMIDAFQTVVKNEKNESVPMTVESTMQITTGHESTEVFNIGVFGKYPTDDDGNIIQGESFGYGKDATGEVIPVTLPDTDDDISAMAAEMLTFMSAAEFSNGNWFLYSGLHNISETTASKTIIIPFSVRVGLAADYDGVPNSPNETEEKIINVPSDLSNISFRVAGVFINAVPHEEN